MHGRRNDNGLDFHWKSERDYKEGTHPCQCDDRVPGFDDDRAANKQATLASELPSKLF